MALPYDQLENLVCIRSYKILYDLMSDFSTWAHNPFDPPASTFIFRKPHDYRVHVMNYRNLALKQAQLSIIHQQQLAKLCFNRNGLHPKFQLGDLVWMKRFGT